MFKSQRIAQMKKDMPKPSKGMGVSSEESTLMKTSAGKIEGKGGLSANMGNAVKFLNKQVRNKDKDMDCDY